MKYLILLMALLSVVAGTGFMTPSDQPQRISSSETVVELISGLPFMARVDTGAHSCSIHCEAMQVDDPAKDPRDNIGKSIRFQVKNKSGQTKWVRASVADYVNVRTSESVSGRYKVWLPLRCQGVHKKVMVTLNNREHMNYPMLIGRNFLRDDFLVAVE